MEPRSQRPRFSRVAAAVVGLLASVWTAAVAVIIGPGEGPLPLVGAVGFAPGVVIADDVVPFTIYVSGSSGPIYFEGALQRRVVRMESGDLAFAYRIRDTVNRYNGLLRYLQCRGFGGFLTDCEYSLTSDGTVGPQFVARSVDGVLVQFDFGTAAFAGPAESHFIYIKTNARYYDLHGTTRIITSTGQSVILPTFRPVSDDTAPDAVLTSPAPFDCVCNPATITGTANDPDGTFLDYRLTAVNAGDASTYAIATGTEPVVNGTLATWNTTGVPQGYYFINLVVRNVTGLSTTATTLVWVDKQFDAAELRAPSNGAIYGATVCFDGSAYDSNGLGCFERYTLSYAPLPAGTPFNPIDPGMPNYTTPVYLDPLGQWNTRSGAAAVPDGSYRVRLTGFDTCGNSRTFLRDITVDNTAPTAVITSPRSCERVEGVIQVRGTASDAHLAGWALQYTGGNTHTWNTIASGTTSVVNGVLGTWDTRRLPACAYTLRLLVSDAASINCGVTTNQSEYTISVLVGCPGDFNLDGVVNSQDYFDFLTAFFTPCP